MDAPRIYLDNAATSWPKPESVYAAVDRYQRQLGAPAGRGAYREAAEVERLVLDARRQIAELIGAPDPRRIVFTLNGTDSLNMAIHGLLRPGDHVVTSVVEHNSVLRPLRWLEERGVITVTRVTCDAASVVDPQSVRAALRTNTRLVAITHASNVTGAIQPIADIVQLAGEHGARTLLDAAQSFGQLPLDLRELPVDLLAAPGHKSLLGPLGTGVLYVAPSVERELVAVRQGGTGTNSESDAQPDSLPEKFESGNLNVAGIVGLAAGVAEVRRVGVAAIRKHHRQRIERFLDGVRSLPDVRVIGPASAAARVGVISLCLKNFDPQEVAAILDSAHRIQVRAGYHCAGRLHATLGTAATGGTVRFSVGQFTTEQEIDAAVTAIGEMVAG